MDDLNRASRDRALAVPSLRIFRDRSSPFETLSDAEFFARFRFTRNGFHGLLGLMTEIEDNRRGPAPLSLAQRLAITLQVLAGNSFQLTVGDLFGVSQPTVSRCVEEITDYFAANVHKFVMWHSEQEAKAIANRVFRRYRLPGVVGAIDGTHVRIMAPRENEYVYVNRKGYHSLNVATVVDDNYRILWFSAQWPGSTHDSKAFRESKLHEKFASGAIFGRLVGDSAYKAEKYLIKVYTGNTHTLQQQRYNNAVCAFRVVVEQTFGQVKRIFSILHGEMRYDPLRASRIVATAFSLRNLQLKMREPEVKCQDSDGGDDEDDSSSASDGAQQSQKGSATMDAIVANYF